MSQHAVILATALDTYRTRIELHLRYWRKQGKVPIWPGTLALASLMLTATVGAIDTLNFVSQHDITA